MLISVQNSRSELSVINLLALKHFAFIMLINFTVCANKHTKYNNNLEKVIKPLFYIEMLRSKNCKFSPSNKIS